MINTSEARKFPVFSGFGTILATTIYHQTILHTNKITNQYLSIVKSKNTNSQRQIQLTHNEYLKMKKISNLVRSWRRPRHPKLNRFLFAQKQNLAFMRNFFPWSRRKHESSILDLIRNFLVFVKWKCSAQAIRAKFTRNANSKITHQNKSVSAQVP